MGIFLGLAFIFLCAATPSPSPSSFQSPDPLFSGSFDEKYWAGLFKEFTQAQRIELKALAHRQAFEWKELEASQKARKREWDKKEKEGRHQFFEEHSQGTERRTYVKDFVQRRELFTKRFMEEKKQKNLEQLARLEAVRQNQKQKLQEFKKQIDQHQIPASSLWPKSGI